MTTARPSAWTVAWDRLTSLAASEAWSDILDELFGGDGDAGFRAAAEGLRRQVLAGSQLGLQFITDAGNDASRPAVLLIVDPAATGGAIALDGDQLGDGSNEEPLVQLLLEQIGAAINRRLNGPSAGAGSGAATLAILASAAPRLLVLGDNPADQQLAATATSQGQTISGRASAAVAAAWSELAGRASAPGFPELLRQVFGGAADATSFEAAALQLSDRLASGDQLGLRFELESDAEMGQALGAFALVGDNNTPTVYLNADWLATATDAQIRRLLLEEIGHRIDTELNGTTDTAGDEGALFAALVQGGELSAEDLSWLQAEHDQHTLIIDGQAVLVELATITGTAGNDNLTGTTTAGDSISGAAGNDSIVGLSGPDSINGGLGADTMTGGAGLDRFIFAAGDSAVTIGGSGTSGTISGFDVITDFTPGAVAASGETITGLPNTRVSNVTTGSLTASTTWLLNTGVAIRSHSATGGIISFDVAATFFTAFTLQSWSDVAAAVEYLQRLDLGNTGDSVAFRATISGVTRTFVYSQGNSGISPTRNNILIDLVGVAATGLNSPNGSSTLYVQATDTTPPSVLSVVNPGTPQFTLIGGTLSLTLNFSETVRLSNPGSATITAVVDLAAGGTTTITLTASGTATTAAGVTQLTFSNSQPLPTTLTDINGVDVAANSLSITTGTLTDVAGNTASSTFSALTASNQLVDTVAPSVASVVNPGSTQYVIAGGTLSLTLNFSETVRLSNPGSATITAVVDLAAGGTTTITLTASGTATTAAGVTQLTFSNSQPLPTTLTDINGVGVATNSLAITSGTLTDVAGNTVSSAFTALSASNQLVDTVAPTIAISSNTSTLKGGETATITFTLSESSSDFSAADVNVTGGTLSNFSGAGTAYSATFNPALSSTANGVISVASGTFTDAAGNTNADGGETNNTVTITVNTVYPTAPVITAIIDNVGIYTGTVSNGGRTDDTVLVLNGTAGANSSVGIFDGATSLGTTTADASGAWVFTTGTLSDATSYAFNAKVTNAGGNTSSSSTTTITVDTTPPTSTATVGSVSEGVGGPLVTNGGTSSGSAPLVLNGTTTAILGSGEVIRVFDDTTFLGTAVLGLDNSTWTFTDRRTLTNGQSVQYRARIADAAGNQSSPGSSYTVTQTSSVPVISVQNTSIAEGDSGSRQGVFTVALSRVSTQTITTNYQFISGITNPATFGQDYNATSGIQTITFNPGIFSINVPFTVFGDTTVETDETFGIQLSNPFNATYASSSTAPISAFATIVNDDILNRSDINEGVTITSSGNITGTDRYDNLTGDGGRNLIQALAGNDTITGLGEADTITTGTGNDIVVYAALTDSTLFATDFIADFTASTDRLDVPTLPGTVWNRGIVTAGTLQQALDQVYADCDSITAGSQSLAPGQAVVFSWGAGARSTYVTIAGANGVSYDDDLVIRLPNNQSSLIVAATFI